MGWPAQHAGDTSENFQNLSANVRLIAAAPELLEACKKALGWIETSAEGEKATRVVLAAIAKAEGRE